MIDVIRAMLRKPEELKKPKISKEEIASLLKTTPEALLAFENSYKTYKNEISDNFFEVNSRQIKELMDLPDEIPKEAASVAKRIVKELLLQTRVYDSETDSYFTFATHEEVKEVTNEELKSIPEEFRPQLTGTLAKKDVKGESCEPILWFYKKYLETHDPFFYNYFRKGLDMMDLDPITYAIIDQNKISMGYWLPPLVKAVKEQDFFKIPKTKVLKVPLTLLQLTRLEYMEHTPTTLRIVDDFCYAAFDLDDDKEYFIKTGTYSSKFDFRNCHVHGAKEVQELGEYLLFIHFQALSYAGASPCIYGMSTTTEWCVREFIPNNDNLPCIYKGLPLRTEYRVFVDFDDNEVIGISPYWRPDVMKKRFGSGTDADSPHQMHDYVIYETHEDELMARYAGNKDLVVSEVEKLLPHIDLSGQWSIDIMQDGDTFYIIDMAFARNSALVDCVPNNKLKAQEENWIPKFTE